MKWQTVKTVLWSAVGGAIVWWIVLAAVWGWTSPGSAARQADERVQAAMLEALTPICVARFERDAEREAKLAALKQASSWTRADFVTKQGWATMSGNEKPANGVAQACANQILESSS